MIIGKLTRTVGHRKHENLEFSFDRVATGRQRRSRGARVARQHLNDALDLGDAFDIDPRVAQGPDDSREFPRAIGLKPDCQVAGHGQPIVG